MVKASYTSIPVLITPAAVAIYNQEENLGIAVAVTGWAIHWGAKEHVEFGKKAVQTTSHLETMQL